MFITTTLAFALSTTSLALAGAPDLRPSASGPSSVEVESAGRYMVTVSNIGTANTSGAVSLNIQLPVTATSPTVHIMGTLGDKSAACSRVGAQLSCSLPQIRRGRSTSVWFDLALPESVDPLSFTATTSTAGDSDSGNNQVSYTPNLTNPAVAFTPGDAVVITMCTGTNLSSFYECELYPSSQQTLEGVLNGDVDQTISFTTPGAEGYGGSWSTGGLSNFLHMDLFDDLGSAAATFEGFGVPGDCWEGQTTFPGSSYVAMYQVCVQP